MANNIYQDFDFTKEDYFNMNKKKERFVNGKVNELFDKLLLQLAYGQSNLQLFFDLEIDNHVKINKNYPIYKAIKKLLKEYANFDKGDFLVDFMDKNILIPYEFCIPECDNLVFTIKQLLKIYFIELEINKNKK